ncbi:MAG: hypothetical protein J0I19_14480 [Alphaproteobacteria bacterium]|nr:hypothetical protein [Alphaproteobacteria bacterium]
MSNAASPAPAINFVFVDVISFAFSTNMDWSGTHKCGRGISGGFRTAVGNSEQRLEMAAPAADANVAENRSVSSRASSHRITANGTHEHPPKMLVYRRNTSPSASSRFGPVDAEATLRFRPRQ